MRIDWLEFRRGAHSFGFAAREWDSAMGLYHNRARHYDPELGRFISVDPIGFNGGDFNLYRYAANRPISATDPLGTVTAVEYAVLKTAAALSDITAYCALAFGVSDLYHYIVSNVAPALQGRPQPYNPTDANGNGVPDARSRRYFPIPQNPAVRQIRERRTTVSRS